MHNQKEYQTVVDKKFITNLEKEIEFLKSEIITKNEMIKKLLRIKQKLQYGERGHGLGLTLKLDL